MLALVQDLITVVFKRPSHAISCVMRVELCKTILYLCLMCEGCIGFEYECVERCGRHRMHTVVISRCTAASGSFIRALDSTMK